MNQPLSICLVSQEYPEETGWGGIGTYTSQMAHGLACLGHQVCVLSRALTREQIYQETNGVIVYRILPRFNPGGLPVMWRLNRIWEGYHLTVALKLREVVRRHAVDIVEVPALHGETVFFQYLRRRFPLVVRIHSCTQQNMKLNSIPSRLSLRLSHWCEKQAVSLAPGLTAPSRAIVIDNLPYLPIPGGEQQVKIIPNPVDTTLFRPNGNKVSTQEPAILFVGRLQPLKGAHILGQAIPLIWQQHPQARFVFAGRDGTAPEGGSMACWIRNQLPPARQQQVKFTAHLPQEELVSLYRQAAIVVLPSFSESFSYTCVEAMACGKPVIATRCGGPEEIIDDGRTGFLVPAGNAQALADKIISVLDNNDLRQQVGEAAREKAKNQYDTQIVAQQMAALYQTVIGTGQ